MIESNADRTAAQTDRSCPICGSPNRKSVKNINKKGMLFSMVTCKDCGFLFVANPCDRTFDPSGRETAGDDIARTPKDRHVQIKRQLDHFFSSSVRVRIIEIGAGFGNLAGMLHQDARYEYTGYEPSPGRAEYIRSQGIRVETGMFTGRPSGDCVDAIVIDNVLEHVDNPSILLQQCTISLRPGGILLVVVPNRHDLRRLLPGWRNRHFWQPHSHINYFRMSDLKRLLDENGMVHKPFSFCSIGRRRRAVMRLKILLDIFGLSFLALQCYGIKRQDH